MNVDEIKQYYSMRDIVSRYGVQVNRSGMCCCPIHGERNPSMKVYTDSFHCFSCGANGDVIKFVQLMDRCDFKTAYLSLGGTYEHLSDRERQSAEMLRKLNKEKAELAKKKENELKEEMVKVLTIVQNSIEKDEPLSDRWCLAQNMLPKINYWWELQINGEELEEVELLRKLKQFRSEYNSST